MKMSRQKKGKLNYGNWVSAKLIYLPAIIILIFLILSVVSFVFLLGVVIFLLLLIYFAYARFAFSVKGKNIQEKVRNLVLNNLSWNGKGKVLDIGCGSGALTVAIAKKYPESRITGIDYWGKVWEYSKGVCEKNAEIEGVSKQVDFERASASSLPFGDEAFDVVVSNMVFHEVRSTRDKKELIREALRVLKKGGIFVFQDLFLWKSVYGDIDDLIETVKSWGTEKVEFIDTSRSDFITRALKLRFMLGTAGILYGKK